MLTSLDQKDICIIGSGPAGATTSLFLSKAGIPHTILDAAVFPRDKVCGDGYNLDVLRVLNALDPSMVTESVFTDNDFTKSQGVKIIASANKSYHLRMPQTRFGNYPFALTCKRKHFDHFLVKKINSTSADLKLNTKVTSLKKEGNTWNITAIQDGQPLQWNSRFIIGADGDHSTVLRSLGKRKIQHSHYAGGLRQYWKGISGLEADGMLEIYLPSSLPFSYFWIFPLAGGEANVGLTSVSDIVTKRKTNLKQLFEDIIQNDPAIAYRFTNATATDKICGWGLPYASHHREASGDGYLLVGDAASLVYPTIGEGIGPAMMSGMIAAKFIQRAAEAANFSESSFKYYNREIHRRLQESVRYYTLLRRLNPLLFNSIIKTTSATGIAQWYFKRNAEKWVKTAFKPIDIKFD